MDCLCLVAPKDEDLLRYALDGEALSLLATEHLASCPVCQQRLNRYATANDFLLAHLYRCQCPDMTTLSHYCAKMLSAHEEEKVREHIQMCPLCTVSVAETHRFLASPMPFVESDVPLCPVPVRLENNSEPANERPFTVPQKPAVQPRVWPYLHQTDTVTLSLRVKPACQNKLLLTGSLVTKSSADACSFAGIMVELYRAVSVTSIEEHRDKQAVYIESLPTYMEQPLFSARVDEQGTMMFEAVPCGEYLMIVYLPETALVIEKLHIEASFSS